MAAGDMVILRDAAGGESITSTPATLTFATSVKNDGFTVTGNNTITLPANGKYLVMHNFGCASTGGSNRSQAQTYLYDGTNPHDHSYSSEGYIRRTGGCDEAYGSSTCIISTGGSSEDIEVRAVLVDTNTATVGTTAGEGGFQVLELDDTWDYLHLAYTTATEALNNTFENVSWNVQTEYDTGSFTHTTGANGDQITLDTTGHYLVCYTVYYNDSAGRSNFDARLTINGTEHPGTRVSNYDRDANGIISATTTWAGILTVTGTDILRLQVRQSGGSGGTMMASGVHIQAVKLPDTADYFIGYDSAGAQGTDGVTDYPMELGTITEEDTDSLEGGVTTSRVEINEAADYLFFGSFCVTESGALRDYIRCGFAVTGAALEPFARSGGYNRGTTTGDFAGAHSAIILDGLGTSDYVEFELTDMGTQAGLTETVANTSGVTAVNIDSMFAAPPVATDNTYNAVRLIG